MLKTANIYTGFVLRSIGQIKTPYVTPRNKNCNKIAEEPITFSAQNIQVYFSKTGPKQSIMNDTQCALDK